MHIVLSSNALAYMQMDVSKTLCYSNNNGIWYESEPHCHCFDCYSGLRCEAAIPLENCTVRASEGTPFMYGKSAARHTYRPDKMISIR